MADQASDQGRSESRVSWSDVARACGFGVSFGPTLPYCVRVTSTVEKMVYGGREKYGQKQDNRDFFTNITTILPVSGRLVHPTETFLGSAGLPLCPSRAPKRSKWQSRRIIPDPDRLSRSLLSQGKIHSNPHGKLRNVSVEEP